MGGPLGRITVVDGPSSLDIGETVQVMPATVTREMVERAAYVLNAYRDGMELDEDLAEAVLRAALGVLDA